MRAVSLPTCHSFHGVGMEPTMGNKGDFLGASCRLGIFDSMSFDNHRVAAFRSPQVTFRTLSPGPVSPGAFSTGAAPTIMPWPTSPMSNIRALSPGVAPRLIVQKSPSPIGAVQREHSLNSFGSMGVSGCKSAAAPVPTRRCSLPNSAAAPPGRAAALSETKISSAGVTRLQEAARAKPLAPQLRLKNPEAVALERNRRAAATDVTGATNGTVQGSNSMAKARKREAFVKTPRGTVNGENSTRSMPLSRALAGALVPSKLASRTGIGSATTGGSTNNIVYHPTGRSSADDSIATFTKIEQKLLMADDKTPIGSSQTEIPDAQTPVAMVDAQGSATQDTIKRRAADLLRGAAQTGTLSAAFGAMVSERHDASLVNAGDGSIDSLLPLLVQPAHPPVDSIPNVATVEVPTLPQTPTSTVSTHKSSPIASAVQVSGRATETPRSLSQEQEVLSPVASAVQVSGEATETPRSLSQEQEVHEQVRQVHHTANCFGDTGGVSTPSQTVQLVPQEQEHQKQQEQQEPLWKARRPAERSCCFGFLHRNAN